MRPLHLDNDTAVSPVIGMVMMLGITIILAGIVYVFSSNIAGDGYSEDGPALGLTVDERNDRINVVSADNGLTWDEFRIIPSKSVFYSVSSTPLWTMLGANVGSPISITDPIESGNHVGFCSPEPGPALEDVDVIFVHIETNSQATSAIRFDSVSICDTDTDGDGVFDGDDNCVDVDNPDQDNWDGDATGDACEASHGDDDLDNDGFTETAGDACTFSDKTNGLRTTNAGPQASNQTNSDFDQDGCFNDEDPDIDGDGTVNCEAPTNVVTDTDMDGDADFDGEPNLSDSDVDGDGLLNSDPDETTPWGIAADGTACSAPPAPPV